MPDVIRWLLILSMLGLPIAAIWAIVQANRDYREGKR